MNENHTQNDAMTIANSLDSSDFIIGKRYFVRTATYHHVGTFAGVRDVFGTLFIHLINCKFITESGELDPVFKGNVSLKTSEPEPNIKIQIAFISDFYEADLVK